MKLLLKNGGEYHVTSEGDVLLCLIFKIKGPNVIRCRNGVNIREDLWVMRKTDGTFEGCKKYKSLTKLLKNEFPFGFTNRPGPLKIVEKVYGKVPL